VGKDTKLYLHIFDWPANHRLILPGIGNMARRANRMGFLEDLAIDRQGSDLIIRLPEKAPQAPVTVVELEIVGAPIVYKAPTIEVASGQFVRSIRVALSGGARPLEIRYTLDGTDPKLTSTRYVRPFTVSRTSTLRAAAFHEGRRVTPVASVRLAKVQPHPALPVAAGSVPAPLSLSMKEYTGDWDRLPDFDQLTPAGPITSITSITSVTSSSKEYVARLYEGTFTVPGDAVYVFGLTSDDGSRLWIDGELVVDNDGLHGSVLKRGSIALQKGLHRIKVGWFNKTGGHQLDLSWRSAELP
jgi:hypothetical protein